MGLFKRKKTEERAETLTPEVDNLLLSALIGRETLTKQQVLNIPSVSGCVKYAGNMVSMLPIKLYKENNGEVKEILNDDRVKLLNDDTSDTLDAVQMWRAAIEDYYLGKGGYIYIKRAGNNFESLHYVEENNVSFAMGTDPIMKDYKLLVQGNQYHGFEFLKLLRNTRNGAYGRSIVNEHEKILSVAYNSLVFEENLVAKGGNKKGFLKSSKKLTQEILDSLRDAFKKLYSNGSENVVVLNDGIDFQEASNTSVEMQLNENKKTNSEEICKLFQFSVGVINGTGSEAEHRNSFKNGIMPLLRVIESALNRDFLLESEKGSYYFAFDTKEMLKGSIKERYDAYSVAIDKGFMQIDEVRYMEDLKPFGISWINLGLNSVLYDTETKQIYTPNTDKQTKISDEVIDKTTDTQEAEDASTDEGLEGGETDENRD